MNNGFTYLGLFSAHHLAALQDWIAETGELYLHLEFPHSGGSGSSYLVRSLRDLKELLSAQTHPEIEIFIFRRLQFPVRGIADDDLLVKALETIPDNSIYDIISLVDFRSPDCPLIGGGENHVDLKHDFSQLRGENIGLGLSPIENLDLKWVYAQADEVMYLTVKKNRNYYEKYTQSPEIYEETLKAWIT